MKSFIFVRVGCGQQFVAVGYNQTLYSSDGIHWEQYDTDTGIRAISWNGSQYIAVGSMGCSSSGTLNCGLSNPLFGKVYSSNDGKHWTLIQEFNVTK